MRLIRHARKNSRSTDVLESQEIRYWSIGLGNPVIFVEPIHFVLGYDSEGRQHEVVLTVEEAEKLRDELVKRLAEFRKIFPQTEGE